MDVRGLCKECGHELDIDDYQQTAEESWTVWFWPCDRCIGDAVHDAKEEM